jgi:hypothetical protein
LKLNFLIVPGLAKNISSNGHLQHFQIVNFKFSHHSWEVLGNAIGKSKSILRLLIVGCNLNSPLSLELLMKGLINNESLEKIDLSDNQIKDTDGLFIIRYIKI